MFYSSSNIDTREEFERRLCATRRLAEADGVSIVVDEYDHDGWVREVAHGFENEPEKGKRCDRCFRYNLAKTAEYAKAHGFDSFTTSLTVSPHKVSPRIFAAGADAAWSVGVKDCGGGACAAPQFLPVDFKKKDGFLRSTRRAAELGLYRQSFCGCEFSRRGR